jgi:hypothetical protein
MKSTDVPYPTVKTYDPYGDLQRAGKPGPSSVIAGSHLYRPTTEERP